MSLTITLPADVEDRLRAEAAAEGSDPVTLVTALVSEAFAVPEQAALAASAADLRDALDEALRDQSSGNLFRAEEVVTHLRARAALLRQERDNPVPLEND